MDPQINIQELETVKIDDPNSITQEPGTTKINHEYAITDLLWIGAISMAVLTCWWAMMLMQGGIFFTTEETKDCMVVIVIYLFISFRHGMNFCHSISAWSMWASIKQLALPLHFIFGLLYWCKVVSTILCAVLSVMRLVSQDFGETKVANMATRNFSLNVFYVFALIEAVLSLLVLLLREFFKPAKGEKKTGSRSDEPKNEKKKDGDKKGAPTMTMTLYNPYSQQQHQSNNFGANRRKGPSVDPAGNGKQTEEKKVEVKKSQ